MKASSTSAADARCCGATGSGQGPTPTSVFATRWCCYERAEPIRPANNDEALLRWNACARDLQRCKAPQETAEEQEPQLLE